jgi:hypothetical protein
MAYHVGVYRVVRGKRLATIAEATIKAKTHREAVRRARQWAATVEGNVGSWLEVLHNGACIKRFAPGQF